MSVPTVRRYSPTKEALAYYYGLDLSIVITTIDPFFRFMPSDHDGVILERA